MSTNFRIIYGLSLICMWFCIKSTEATCNATNLFGPDCEFKCHCMNNSQCDRSTGDCPSGCDFEWVGPACQRRNIVFSATTISARQRSITSLAHYAHLAVDKNSSTCSITNYNNRPWWKLWLSSRYNIRNISILTEMNYFDDFKKFQVMVENSTRGRYNMYSDRDICYTHDDTALTSRSIDIACDKTLIGNQIRIQLAGNNTRLILCDVRIYGECDNGTFGAACTEKCSTHCEGVCDKDYGTCAFCKAGWTGSRCARVCEDGKYGVNCTRECSPFCRNSTACRNTDGICVNGCSPGYTREKCDAKCTYGTYGQNCGFNCSGNCVNESICRHSDGYCLSGCEQGWKGHTCHDKCKGRKYGPECASNCSTHCLNGSVCIHTNGICTDGCDPGWTGNQCFEACVDGFYGHACLHKCSQNCAGGYSDCDNVDGSCLSGCKAGWTGRTCDEVCASGSWGLKCAKLCGHCISRVCQHTNGVCDGSCAAGFKQTPHCDTDCDNGSYGINCSRTCSMNCKDICNKQSGQCKFCKSGWHGAKCTLECVDGKWGESCKRICFTCHNHTCDRFSGTCNGQCKPGFKQTEYCDHECSSGWYGINCSKECNPNCKDVDLCRKTDGVCSECKLGMEGIMCEKESGTNVHISGEGVAGVLVAFVVLILISVAVAVLVMRRKLKTHRSRNTFENATVSYSNVLAEELHRAEATETAYDTIKRTSGIEHIYD